MAAKRNSRLTSLEIGEENPPVTTMGLGEENPPITSLAMGEEFPPVTTLMWGEENGWFGPIPMPGAEAPGTSGFPKAKRRKR